MACDSRTARTWNPVAPGWADSSLLYFQKTKKFRPKQEWDRGDAIRGHCSRILPAIQGLVYALLSRLATPTSSSSNPCANKRPRQTWACAPDRGICLPLLTSEFSE